MKIKIKKNKKDKEYRLINSWDEVTLEKWLQLVDLDSGLKSQEAQKTIEVLSTIPLDLINQLELKDVAVIMGKIAELQKEKNSSLKKKIEIEGKVYGFHPDLDSITLGEWADLETYIKDNMRNNLTKIMAILYRPIVEETETGVYTIEAYDGDIAIRTEEMKKMKAEEVQEALVFFYHFVMVLLMTSESYLMEVQKEMMMQSPQSPSAKDGAGSV